MYHARTHAHYTGENGSLFEIGILVSTDCHFSTDQKGRVGDRILSQLSKVKLVAILRKSN